MNQYPQEEKKRLFGRKKTVSAESSDSSEQITSLNSRLRVLEERINNLNRKIEINESSDLNAKKRINIEIKTINSETTEIKNSIEEVKEKMEIITRELPNLAVKDELDVLRKYIEMWEPMNFVTRKELDKLLTQKKS